MNTRSLSIDQLKDLRKRLKRTSSRWFWFEGFAATIDAISLDDIQMELKRRKKENLKMGRGI